jgi:hypothetical protein
MPPAASSSKTSKSVKTGFPISSTSSSPPSTSRQARCSYPDPRGAGPGRLGLHDLDGGDRRRPAGPARGDRRRDLDGPLRHRRCDLAKNNAFPGRSRGRVHHPAWPRIRAAGRYLGLGRWWEPRAMSSGIRSSAESGGRRRADRGRNRLDGSASDGVATSPLRTVLRWRYSSIEISRAASRRSSRAFACSAPARPSRRPLTSRIT